MGFLWLQDAELLSPGDGAAWEWRPVSGDVRLPRRVRDMPTGQPPPDGWERLRLTTALDGPAAPTVQGQAPFHYVVETDVVAGAEDDFHAWYETEHLPGLARVPGTVRACRYLREVAAAGLPRHYACYDLIAPDVTASPEWLAVRHTAWSSRVRPTFVNPRRTMFSALR